MQNPNEIKEIVKEKYGEIAKLNNDNSGCCETSGCCGTNKVVDYEVFTDSYEKLEGHFAGADLGLGCGLPTEFAQISKGDIVLDLGSGAGNDVFVARALTGENGKVIGVDMTEEMIEIANKNKEKLGFTNVDFRFGEIEDLPVESDSVDVVVSNCVLNLVPNKQNAFNEMYRVIKPGGHFSVSDIVLQGVLPANLQKSAEMYAGCVAGAIQEESYLNMLKKTGFKNVEVQKRKTINLPQSILQQYLNSDEIESFKNSRLGIHSITVFGSKA